MQDERCMGSFDLVFWAEIQWDTVFPSFEFLVQFTNGIEELAISLLGSLDGVKLLVNFTFNQGECTHEAEKIKLSFSIGKRDIANIVWWVVTRKLNIHIVIILDRWSAGTEADTDNMLVK